MRTCRGIAVKHDRDIFFEVIKHARIMPQVLRMLKSLVLGGLWFGIANKQLINGLKLLLQDLPNIYHASLG